MSTDAVAAMSFSVPPQSEEVRSALADHVIETNQLEYAAKFGTTAVPTTICSCLFLSSETIPALLTIPEDDAHLHFLVFVQYSTELI